MPNNMSKTKTTNPKTNKRKIVIKRRKVNNKSKQSLQTKTIHEVQTALRSMSITKAKVNHPYLNCRFNPFSSGKSSLNGIPDGDNSRRIVIDHTSFSDISVTSGQFNIRILPSLPYGALINFAAGSAYTIADATAGTATIASQGSLFSRNNTWTPINAYQEYASAITSTSSLSAIANPYGASKVRVVGMAWRLIYTGTAANCNGILAIKDSPFSIDRFVGVAPSVLILPNPANTSSANVTTATSIACMDFSAPSNMIAHCKEVRPESNPWGIIKHNAKIYSWKEYFEQPFFPISSTTTNTQLASTTAGSIPSIITQNPSTYWSGFNFLDDGWSSTDISISAISNAVSFRLETKLCVEYLIPTASPLYALTKTPPLADNQIMQYTENIARNVEPAYNYNEPITINGQYDK